MFRIRDGRPLFGTIAYRVATGLLVALTLWAYIAVARQTGPVSPALVRDYTERLAAGHASLSITPDPRLLALPNPYDPKANAGYRVMDASLYEDRYYLYFGITPFVSLLVPWYVATGQHLTTTSAVLLFCSGGFLVYVLLLSQIRRRFFPAGARFATLLGIALAGWCGGQLSLLRLPDIHDTEISCAYFWFALVLFACFRALVSTGRAVTWIAVAATAVGLGVGARPNLIVAVPLLIVFVFWVRRSAVGPARTSLIVALFAPLMLIGGLLAAYNFTRFDNPLEFGITYQLSTLDRVHHPTLLLERVPYALHRYLFGGFRVGAYFPFIEGDLPGPITRPASHDEPGQFYGFLVTTPALLIALMTWGALRAAPLRDLRGLATFATTVALAQLILMLPAGMGAHRYATDLLPPVLLVCGLVLQRLASHGWVMGMGVSVVLYSCLLGFLQSAALFGIYQASRPESFARTARWFNTPLFLAERMLEIRPTYPRLRVQLPTGGHAPNEPLLVFGDRGRENFIYLNYAGPNLIRIGIEVMGRGGPVSGFLPVDPAEPHDIELDLGVFYPPEGHPFYSPAGEIAAIERRRRAIIRLDGKTVIDSPVDFHPPRKTFQWGHSDNDAAFGHRFSGPLLSRVDVPARL